MDSIRLCYMVRVGKLCLIVHLDQAILIHVYGDKNVLQFSKEVASSGIQAHGHISWSSSSNKYEWPFIANQTTLYK